MVCAPVPLKFTVLPVMVCPTAAPGVKVVAMPIVPLLASVLLKLLKVRLP